LNQRLLVILIVVLIVLFIIAIVMAAGNTENRANPGLLDDSEENPLSRLRVNLSLDDVDLSGGGCDLLAQESVLEMDENAECELEIKPAQFPIGRKLRLELLSGFGVTLRLEQPDADPPALDDTRNFANSDDVDDEGAVVLSIFNSGGRLRLENCADPNGCRVKLN
jgi:hypothetical protein